MAARSGIAAQLMFAEEVTVGTGVTPTLTLPIVSETLEFTREDIQSDAIMPGRGVATSGQLTTGNGIVSGGVQGELYAKGGVGTLFKHAFGSVTTTGSNPYSHDFRLSDTYGKGLTIQKGVPGVGGTVRPLTYSGCKISELAIGFEQGKIVTFGFDIMGMSATKATALASPDGSTVGNPFKFSHCTLSLGGSAQSVISGEFKLSTPLRARHFLGTATSAEPIVNGLREASAQFKIEWTDFTYYDLFTGGTEAAVSWVATNGTETLTITGNGWFDANSPKVSGRDVVEQDLPVRFTASTSNDYSAFRAVLTGSTESTV